MPVPDNAKGKISVGQYQFAGISAHCKYPEEAFAFLEFLCGNLLYTMKVFDFHSMDGHAARQAAG